MDSMSAMTTMSSKKVNQILGLEVEWREGPHWQVGSHRSIREIHP